MLMTLNIISIQLRFFVYNFFFVTSRGRKYMRSTRIHTARQLFRFFFSFFFIIFFYFGNEMSLLAKFSKRRNFTDAVREVKSVSLTYFHSSVHSPSSAALKFSFTFSHLISPDYIKA